MLEELKNPKHDWRTILANFIQEEVNDYSFSPPDRRYDGDFFLPDFNDTDISVKNILFMIDTSGSMSTKMITEMYSEICGAIEQFNGKLSGYLGFFDAEVVPPKEFTSTDEFKMIKPKGGGGTDFNIIFDYIKENMQDNFPNAVVILTDGYATFPRVEKTLGLPILWVINSNEKPPYGKLIKI
jgi:predicted metal-dependent peptidase